MQLHLSENFDELARQFSWARDISMELLPSGIVNDFEFILASAGNVLVKVGK
ncbi:MAG: hypothetical protein OK422_05455 [Thaumarchaeota archaeon]|nr:hypothetical protein [Nitrososphaerota archaeon]